MQVRRSEPPQQINNYCPTSLYPSTPHTLQEDYDARKYDSKGTLSQLPYFFLFHNESPGHLMLQGLDLLLQVINGAQVFELVLPPTHFVPQRWQCLNRQQTQLSLVQVS